MCDNRTVGWDSRSDDQVTGASEESKKLVKKLVTAEGAEKAAENSEERFSQGCREEFLTAKFAKKSREGRTEKR
jgi:hypothetical protein